MQGDSFKGNSEELSPTESGSKLRGLRVRYESNRQVIAAWREYGRLARWLRREYRGREGEQVSGMVASWIVASQTSEQILMCLVEEQLTLESEIQHLIGQLALGDGDAK